jgi:hypothetical protein
MFDSTGGPFTYAFPNPAELIARDDARGAFSARPPARVPNTVLGISSA